MQGMKDRSTCTLFLSAGPGVQGGVPAISPRVRLPGVGIPEAAMVALLSSLLAA